jgi:hypothetical protein
MMKPFFTLLFVSFTLLGFTQNESQNAAAINLDSCLFRIRKATDDTKADLLSFPDTGKINETALLMSDMRVSLHKVLVAFCVDDLRKTALQLKPEFVALWHHSIADYKTTIAEYANRTGKDTDKERALKEAIPHLQDVNAYLLDHNYVEYKLFGKQRITIYPEQQKAVIARHKAISKKKK